VPASSYSSYLATALSSRADLTGADLTGATSRAQLPVTTRSGQMGSTAMERGSASAGRSMGRRKRMLGRLAHSTCGRLARRAKHYN
jgi:hypothetical protein